MIDALIAFGLGLFVGGLVNLLADDLPFSFRVKPPHYPDGTPRPPRLWLGLSVFLSGRRAGPDGRKLSWRHPLTEVITGGLFAYVAATSATPGSAFYLMGCVALLILITVIDLEHRMILIAVVVTGGIYTLIGAGLFGRDVFPRVAFNDYLFGGLAGFLLFGALYLGGWSLTE